MNTEHLAEGALQQYAIAPAECGESVHAHIHSCENCRQKTIEYRLLFDCIRSMERPRFEMDLAGLILPQLKPSTPGKSIKIPVSILYILIALPVTGLLVYLFNTYLSGLLVGITPVLIWLVTTAIVGVAGFIGIDAYLHFKKQMNQLNYFKNLQH